ncbi:MAG: ribosome maturation factor RimP [Ruminococcus sp.]|nr:ribosome maturation factor RimP [Ruminococcus sp.]MDE7098021.1 ribosome maturation factor RimP [Ruminococcus sp.]
MKLKKFGSTEQKVYDLVKPITDELGYYLWDVSYVKEGASWYLRIFIDCDEGITIEDCEIVTEPVNKILDETDPIPQSYTLEVGSAGLERELLKEDHFEVCKGDKVRIRFIRNIDGEKEICAYLKGADKNQIVVYDENNNEKVYSLSDVAFVKLWFEFE